ncbi:MAG: aminotransferase class I/II-fold pyridoxal phosphate-dependent enzyme [Lachnospiraceae bacterium]|nr:aminotransferase class I/II-fold pyridoxal phosphate-dependent enzyme [Lachnospiraceae bacterium]
MRFNNDYNRGAHPEILKLLNETNDTSYPGYGTDEWCVKASDEIKKYLGGVDCDIHFMEGGTQVNYTVIASALRPFQGVISADTGHINVHETGAVENTGHKVITIPHKDGKIFAEDIEKLAVGYEESGIPEHVVMPKMVYISFPTEYGTIYSKEELTAISKVCREHALYLFVDGARLGYGLGSDACDLTIEDIAKLSDVFYIGGTKCGALFGEAVVISHPELRPHFRSFIKQNGGMLAKGWLLGLQFYALFKDGLYFRITEEADRRAMEIRGAFLRKGLPLYIDSPTNQQFIALTDEQAEQLAAEHVFEFEGRIDEGHICARFCTSFATVKEETDALIRSIEKL